MQEIIHTSLTITAFVMLMMIVIEYINVQTQGKWDKPLRKKKWLQIVIAALLGAVPGCLGVYTVVSLFTHKVVSFGALVSAMIATSGDEAFVMFAMVPRQALWLSLTILALAIIAGFIVNVFFKNIRFGKQHDHQFHIHQLEVKSEGKSKHKIIDNIKNMSFTRGIVLTSLLLFLLFLFTGIDLHNHSFSLNKIISSESPAMQDGRLTQPLSVTLDEHLHDCNHEAEQEATKPSPVDACELHDHSHEGDLHNHHEHGDEAPFNVPKTIFVVLTLFSVFIVVVVSNHFVEEHIWNHVIKKHFLKIFLWTLGTLMVIYFANNWSQDYFHFDIKTFANSGLNMWIILLVAILLGILPESGPHMIFISLFATGIIPLSILMANSIVQDGHGSLPLLAENKKAFFHMKWINMLVGLIVGSLGLFFGF